MSLRISMCSLSINKEKEGKTLSLVLITSVMSMSMCTSSITTEKSKEVDSKHISNVYESHEFFSKFFFYHYISLKTYLSFKEREKNIEK